MKRLQHLDEQANDADRRLELTAPRTLRASELTEEILIDPPERVALGGRGNLRHLLEQILQERAVENLVCLWQDGLGMQGKPPRGSRYKVNPHPFAFKPGVDVGRLNQLVDELEADELARQRTR